MRNPFFYGGTAFGESFCNRSGELRDLKNAVDSSLNLFLFGERRLGKTSLLRKLMASLPDDDYIKVYIDLWVCSTEDIFIRTCAAAFTQVLEKTPQKLLNRAKELFSSFSPTITLDSSGNPTLTLNSATLEKTEPLLEQVLSLPQMIADKYPEKQVVVILDEFQQIKNFKSDHAERVLRSVIQNHDSVAYLFCGSKKHVIQQMFMDRKSPLFRSAGHYPIEVIDLSHWREFIKSHFSNTGKSVGDDMVEKVVSVSGGHPFYTQLLCSTLWELMEPGRENDSQMLEEAIDLLLNREQYAYMTLWETLPLNARQMLIAASVEEYLEKPYSSEIMMKYGLKTPSAAQRALAKLKNEEIVEIDNSGRHYVADRFFALWIRRRIPR